MNKWIDINRAKRLREDMARIIDETLDDEGYYAGMEIGEISEAEAERTYWVLASVMRRTAEYLAQGCLDANVATRA